MFKAKTPEPSRDIVSGHDMSPTTFQVTYCNVDLLELVMAISLGKCHFNAILFNSLVKISMSSREGGGHVDFEVGWYPDFVAKAA